MHKLKTEEISAMFNPKISIFKAKQTWKASFIKVCPHPSCDNQCVFNYFLNEDNVAPLKTASTAVKWEEEERLVVIPESELIRFEAKCIVSSKTLNIFFCVQKM
jgi:hypothetical protein